MLPPLPPLLCPHHPVDLIYTMRMFGTPLFSLPDIKKIITILDFNQLRNNQSTGTAFSLGQASNIIIKLKIKTNMKNSRKIAASVLMSLAMSGAVFAQDGLSADKEMEATQSEAVIASDVNAPTIAEEMISDEAQVLAVENTEAAEAQDPAISKMPIEMEEVPTVVQEALEDSDYNADEVTEVYKVKQTTRTLYEFVIQNDGLKWAVHFDESGNYVAKKEVG